MLQLPYIMNFRDLGGLACKDGSILRMRKLYRCGSLQDLTGNDRALLSGPFKVRSIIDLRTRFERSGHPDPKIPGVENLQVPLVPVKTIGITFEDGNLTEMIRGTWDPDTFDICSIYRNMVDQSMAQSWQTIFKTLLNSGDRAVLWHCTNGKDRTGVVAAVILLALGVPYETVMADYLATNRSTKLNAKRKSILEEAERTGSRPGIGDKIGALLEARPEYLNVALDAIDDNYGCFGGFLEDACRLSIAEDDELRRLFLQ